jgi:hypothetical protein
MKANLKLILMSLAIVLLATATGFSQEKKIDLKSPDVQGQVFNQILNDHQTMENFIAALKTNDHALKMVTAGITPSSETNANTCCNMMAMMAGHNHGTNEAVSPAEKVKSEQTIEQHRPKYRHK